MMTTIANLVTGAGPMSKDQGSGALFPEGISPLQEGLNTANHKGEWPRSRRRSDAPLREEILDLI